MPGGTTAGALVRKKGPVFETPMLSALIQIRSLPERIRKSERLGGPQGLGAFGSVVFGFESDDGVELEVAVETGVDGAILTPGAGAIV